MAVKTKEGRGRRAGAAAAKEAGAAPGTGLTDQGDLTDHGEGTWTGSASGEGEAEAGGNEGWTMAVAPTEDGRTAALEAEVKGLRAENEALRARLAVLEGTAPDEDEAEPAQDPLLGTLSPAWAAWKARREGGAQ